MKKTIFFLNQGKSYVTGSYYVGDNSLVMWGADLLLFIAPPPKCGKYLDYILHVLLFISWASPATVQLTNASSRKWWEDQRLVGAGLLWIMQGSPNWQELTLGCSLGTRCQPTSIFWMRKPGSEISWLAKVGGQVCGRARIPIQTSEFQCDMWVLSTKADMPSKGFLLIEDFRKHQVRDPMFITLNHGELRALCRDNCASAYRLSKFVVIYKW